MKAIDPSVQPRASGTSSRSNDLIFLDLEERRSRSNSLIAKRATQGLDIIHTGEFHEIPSSEQPQAVEPPAPTPEPELLDAPVPGPEILETPIIEPALLDGVTRAGEFEHEDLGSMPGPLDGLDTTAYNARDAASPLDSPGMIRDLEPTDIGSSFAPATTHAPSVSASAAPPASVADDALLDVTLPEPSEPPRRPSLSDLPLIPGDDTEDLARAMRATSTDAVDESEPSIGGDLSFIAAGETPAESVEAPALNDIPLMDLALPTPGEAMASITGSPVDAGPTIDFLELDDSAMPERGNEDVVDPTIEQPVDESQFVSVPTPAPAPRPATIEAEHTVEMLRALVDEMPEDHFKRRQLGEAMLESGHRDDGLRELETAMIGFERADELDAAASVADEIVRVDPESIRHHQKRVEYAFRTNERGRLIEAYVALADALFRSGQMDKSRAI
jgi:hypothetical protein